MNGHNTTAHQQRLLADQILDRIAHDSAFHQQLLDDTAQALQSSGFAQALEANEVVGYAAAMPCWGLTCRNASCGLTCLIFTSITIVK